MLIEVSVVVPVKDEYDRYISQCLESLKKQNYQGIFEILVIKGGNIAQARNLGIKQARGEIVAFIDSDCMAPENWLSEIVEILKKSSYGGVGGTNLSPEHGSLLGKAIDEVFAAFLGSLGSASLSKPSKPKYVNAIACINSAFWHKTLQNIGGFDEEFQLCEDTNLSYKVRSLGYNLLLDPKIKVWHFRRDTYKSFAKQFFIYGIGRMRSILTKKEYATKSVVLFFIGALLFPLVFWFSPAVGISIFIFYLAVLLVKGFQGALKNGNTRFLMIVPGLFIIEHFSFLFGLIVGLTQGAWKKPQGSSELLYRLIISKNV